MTTILDSPATDHWLQMAAAIGAELADGVAERDRTGDISTSAFRRLREDGITAALVPTEFGGGGLSHAGMGAVLRELGRHDGATAVTLSMHAHPLAAQVWRHRHGQDASGVFAKVVGGAMLLSSGGSDWLGSNGSATRVDDGYRVSARKTPISGCEVGDILITSIRWEGAADGPKVLHCAVPCASEGAHIEPSWDTLGLRATGSHTVVFDDVFVPDAAVSLVREADLWAPIWNVVMGAALPLVMSAYLGIADAALAEGVRAAAGRDATHVHQYLGEALTALLSAEDAIRAMFADADDLGFANDDGIAARTLARKTTAVDGVIDTVRLVMEATGGLGYRRSSVLERHYRDVHGCLFHPLPRARQSSLSGRVLLGLTPV